MADQRKPRLLSLDGGGARGLTQLFILAHIIHQLILGLNKDRNVDGNALEDENIYPCRFFDLITGSGTGGINAIMIGRLGMSIKQCTDAWVALFEALKVNLSANQRLLSSDSLERWAKALVKQYTGRENTRMLEPAVKAGERIGDPKKADLTKVADEDLPMNFNTNDSQGCKVSVTAMRAQNVGMSTLFRTYRVRANQEFNCEIWEAIRATTASPLLYEPILIGKDWSKQQFINAELGANNPIGYMIEEKQKVWLRQGNWPPPDIGCIVSIGSGKGKLISMPTEPKATVTSTFTGFLWKSESPTQARERLLYEVMVRIAKDCEKKHQQIKESYGRDEEHVYFRFNIEHGLQEIEEADYNETTAQSIRTAVRDYLEHADSSIPFEEVVEKLAELTTDGPRRRTTIATTPVDSTAPPAYEKAGYSGP